MALKHVMINDIIAEHSARMQNLKKYYPFFVLNEATFSQYKEGKYSFLDMGYITKRDKIKKSLIIFRFAPLVVVKLAFVQQFRIIPLSEHFISRNCNRI